MASLNQKLLIITKLHKALHRNVYLLSLRYPMSKDVAAHFKEGMFEKPNGTAFHHISYYLMSIIDPECVTSSSSWAMFEIKMEAKYRSEFLKFVSSISKQHVGHISHIMPSWLVNAGGIKVAKLMFELSQVALKLHIRRTSTKQLNLEINEINIIEIHSKNADVKEILINKVTQWHTVSQNMKNIANIYQRNIPILASDKLYKTKLIESVFTNVNLALSSEPDFGRELCDVFATPDMIKKWHTYIKTKISDAESDWHDVSSNIIGLAKKCRNRSDQLVVMHTKRPCKDFILEYNELRDKFQVPALFESGLSVTQSAILKSNIINGVLDFPNIFNSYSVIISHSFQSYVPSQSTDYLLSILEEKKKLIMFIMQQSKELTAELFKFHNQLKEVMATEQYSYASAESSAGIYEVSNIPSLCFQPRYAEDASDYWCKCLERLKFLEFNHPFKSEKVSYILEDDVDKSSLIKQSHSLIRNGLEFDSQLKQSFNISNNSRVCLNQFSVSNNRPDYMKHIAELKRNMEKISDVANKTCLNQHNLTTISRFGTEGKQSAFMSNHLRNMLTSIKKRPISDQKVPKLNLNDHSFRKTWGNLFNESSEDSSVLQKTRSSPNLLSLDEKESKKRSRITRPVSVTLHERISGVKEIDYSSFLSELGSTPDLSSSSQKENIPSNDQCVIVSETVYLEKRTEIDSFSDGDFKVPENTSPNQKITSPNRRKSLLSLIDTYKKFRESRLRVSDEKKVDTSSKSIDSFLENLDLGHSKELDKKDDLNFLSPVPDLLSPSLDFQIRHAETNE